MGEKCAWPMFLVVTICFPPPFLLQTKKNNLLICECRKQKKKRFIKMEKKEQSYVESPSPFFVAIAAVRK